MAHLFTGANDCEGGINIRKTQGVKYIRHDTISHKIHHEKVCEHRDEVNQKKILDGAVKMKSYKKRRAYYGGLSENCSVNFLCEYQESTSVNMQNFVY